MGTRKNDSKPKYRKKTRELLVRLIFQMTLRGDFSEAAKDAFLADTSLYLGDTAEDTPPGCIFDEKSGELPDLPYLNWAFLCVQGNLEEIDRAIDGAGSKWSTARMSAVDLAILRVTVAELKYLEDIDTATSINEAVMMAKKYGTEKSPAFVNGILGQIARTDENPDQPDQEGVS